MTLSAHLVQSYEKSTASLAPQALRSLTFKDTPVGPVLPTLAPDCFGGVAPDGKQSYKMADPDQSWLSNHGFAGPSTSMSMAFGGNTSMTGGGPRFSQWSEEKVARMQSRLARKLGPEYVSTRQGPAGGGKLSYIEGWKVINLANEVFGFNGWSSSIVSLQTDYLDVNKEGRCSVNVTAIVRITLQDGAWHEDVGCGQGENIKGKGAALDKAKKEAVTDATKRALRTFGNVLGNCMYDREYTREVSKMKVEPTKFNQNELERRPEFQPAPGFVTDDAGPSRAAPLAQAANLPPPHHGQSVATARAPTREMREETPLRSVHDPPLSREDHVMNESFDAEFLTGEGDTLFDIVDQSIVVDAPIGKIQPEIAPSVPGYQHRHRPYAPQAAGRPFARSTSAGAAARLAAIEGSTTTLVPSLKPEREQMPGEAPRKVVGGFIHGTTDAAGLNAAGNISAQTARMAAIMGVAATTAAPPAPARTDSPRIPAGGIDAAAARATEAMRNNGHRIDLINRRQDIDGDGGAAGGYGGFASARGMKRSISDNENRMGGEAQVTASVYVAAQRTGPRKALGDITMDAPGSPEVNGQGDWGEKRPRVA